MSENQGELGQSAGSTRLKGDTHRHCVLIQSGRHIPWELRALFLSVTQGRARFEGLDDQAKCLPVSQQTSKWVPERLGEGALLMDPSVGLKIGSTG